MHTEKAEGTEIIVHIVMDPLLYVGCEPESCDETFHD